MCVSSLAAFVLYWQTSVVETETAWSKGGHSSLSAPLQKKRIEMQEQGDSMGRWCIPRRPCLAGGQDGPAPAGMPGPAQHQVGPGHGDGHVQEGAGGLRRNIVMKILEMPNVEVMKESKQEHKDVM